MARQNSTRWMLLVMANVLAWCVLSFYQRTDAAPQADNQPFANAVQQRMDMIAQLKEISAELKAQNVLLRSGSLKVVISDSKHEIKDKKR